MSFILVCYIDEKSMEGQCDCTGVRKSLVADFPGRSSVLRKWSKEWSTAVPSSTRSQQHPNLTRPRTAQGVHRSTDRSIWTACRVGGAWMSHGNVNPRLGSWLLRWTGGIGRTDTVGREAHRGNSKTFRIQTGQLSLAVVLIRST